MVFRVDNAAVHTLFCLLDFISTAFFSSKVNYDWFEFILKMDSNENRHNHVDYLIKAASLLPTENYAHKLLKSYYL